ncbi:receptor activity-modifying protein 1 [Tiliqua scincoides]|uniref:receptor activity-modifying protein 1 n=1 Tax=Tiliqua scincoides TaxID=71010 RepID=UPI003462F14C
MALGVSVLLRRFWWFLLAPHFIVVTACHEVTYGQAIQDICVTKFKYEMETLTKALWCDWEKTLGLYKELINCTVLVAGKLDCFWPNPLVDEFFLTIHKHYFKSCPVSGRSFRDPPNTVLCPFILVPIFVTLLMTALVVWRSKQSECIV